jgi:F-type H+-transporting ATPase subunit delta
MKGIRIASRYAKSLLQLAIEKGQVDAAYSDMKFVHATIQSSRELQLLLANPVVKPDTKATIITKIFGSQVQELAGGFMKLLIAKGRESLLMEVAASFVNQVKLHKNITTVDVVSAVALDENTRAKLIALANKMANGTVELHERVDANIIGGFVLRVGDQQVDASVSSEIRDLRRQFEKNLFVAEL